MSTTMLIFFMVFFPLAILVLCNKLKIMLKLGPVILAYIFGIIAGNTDLINKEHHKVLEYISMGSIIIALPLILFSSDIKKWSKIAPRAIISMIIGFAGILLISAIGYKFFGNKIDEGWKVSGMLIGVYTGGTPNLGAIKEALNVKSETYIMTHTYDMAVCAVYLLFLMTMGQKVFSFFLLSYKSKAENLLSEEIDFNGKELFWGLYKKKYLKPLSLAFAISVLIVALSLGIGFQFSEEYQSAIIILLITTLGISASISKKIRSIEKSFELGMYFILIFCLAVSAMADLRQLIIVSPYLFYYVAFAVFGTLMVHVILAYIFKIDTDTVIVTSTALIFSPPFVPVIAGTLKNKDVVLSGIAVGVIGFAVGNYLGIPFAYLMLRVFG